MSGPTLPPAPPMAWQVDASESGAAVDEFAARGIAVLFRCAASVGVVLRYLRVGVADPGERCERGEKFRAVLAGFARGADAGFATGFGTLLWQAFRECVGRAFDGEQRAPVSSAAFSSVNRAGSTSAAFTSAGIEFHLRDGHERGAADGEVLIGRASASRGEFKRMRVSRCCVTRRLRRSGVRAASSRPSRRQRR